MPKKRTPKMDSKQSVIPDHRPEVPRIRKIRGQIEGIERMIEDGRYCIDIVHQIRATIAALRSVESLILERHLHHCVQSALQNPNPLTSEEKINELLTLFNKK